jgi:hypothetical protein
MELFFFFRIYYIQDILSANRDNLIFSFPIWIPSFCLIALARNSNTILSKSGESGHPHLTADFRGNGFSFFPFSLMLAIGLSQMSLLCWGTCHNTDESLKHYAMWVQVAHTWNCSYSGGRDQMDGGLRSAQANSSQDPISKKKNIKPNTKKSWQSGSSGRAPD